jgi:hypothetical protein
VLNLAGAVQGAIVASAMKASSHFCAVCGTGDQRVLSTILLPGGVRAVVCGSHELAFLRAARRPTTIGELRQAVRERRLGTERRRAVQDDVYGVDELATRLLAAFSGERRTVSDRRRG